MDAARVQVSAVAEAEAAPTARDNAPAVAAAAGAGDVARPCALASAFAALLPAEPAPAVVTVVPPPPLASAFKPPLTDYEACTVAGEAVATAAAAMLARLELASCATDDMEQEDDLTANSPVKRT